MRCALVPVLLGVMTTIGVTQNQVVNGAFGMEIQHWKLVQWTGSGGFGTRVAEVKPGVWDHALYASFQSTSGTQRLEYESLPFPVPGAKTYPLTFRCMWARSGGNRPIQGINYITLWIRDAMTHSHVHFRKVFVPNLGGSVDRMTIKDQVQFLRAGLYLATVEIVHTWHASGGFPYTAYVDDINVADSTVTRHGPPSFGSATINSTSWVVGQPVTITGHGAPANMWGGLWLSFWIGGPIRPLPGAEIWIDPTRVIAVVPVLSDWKGRWTYSGRTPSWPLLRYRMFAFQVGFYPLNRWPGFETTPGVRAIVN